MIHSVIALNSRNESKAEGHNWTHPSGAVLLVWDMGGTAESSTQGPWPKWQEQALLRDQGVKAKERVYALMASTKFCHVPSSSSWAPAPHWYSGLRDLSTPLWNKCVQTPGKGTPFHLCSKVQVSLYIHRSPSMWSTENPGVPSELPQTLTCCCCC